MEKQMKLYFTPGACSLAPHFVLEEGGFCYETEAVDLATKETATGEDFMAINAKGYVPALMLDDGQLLTEVSAVLQYLADQVPEKELAPKPGTLERVRLQEWLSFIATELHKNFSPLYNPDASEDWKKAATELIKKRFDFIVAKMGGDDHLMGESYSIADAYLFNVLSWCGFAEMDLSPWPSLQEYMGRIGERPAVQAVLKAEGLLE
jgi:glutathione S-transferase